MGEDDDFSFFDSGSEIGSDEELMTKLGNIQPNHYWIDNRAIKIQRDAAIRDILMGKDIPES